jgi:hypothetical protein
VQIPDAGKWPANTNLFDTGGRNILLLQQDDRIQMMLRASILKILGDLLFEHAFPDGEERTRMSRDAVMFGGKQMKLDDVVNRLKNDIGYLDRLARVVSHSQICDNRACYYLPQAENRISQYRRAIKDSTALHIIEEFGSLRGEPAKVKALLHKQAYIYPFKNGEVRMNGLTLQHGALITSPSRNGINPTATKSFPLSLPTHSSRAPGPSATN